MTTATASSITAHDLGAPRRTASFWNILASEWSKLATLRSTRISLGLGVVLSVATTALVATAIGSTQSGWSADFNPITVSMVGNIFALIIFSVFGVLAMSREYSSGMVRLTLIATPSRSRVLLAKFALVGTIILVLGLITTLSMFFVGQAILGAYGLPVASISDPDAQRMVLGLGAVMPFFPIMGLALAVLLRSTAGGITTVLGLLWLPQIFGAFVPLWFRAHILSLLPSNGVDSITIGHIEPSPAFSAPPLAIAIVCGWLLIVIGSAFVLFARRDA